MIEKYEHFLKDFDKKLKNYFSRDNSMIKCKKGCSLCCSNGDYPLSHLEMCYLMRGFSTLNKEKHEQVKTNIKSLLKNKDTKSYICPFLLNNECSVYSHRPLICRIHGLAYKKENGIVNLPGCSDYNLNYSEHYDGNTVDFEPINEDLSLDKITPKNDSLTFGEIRSLIKWF